MTEQTENLVLEILCTFRGDLAAIRHDIQEIKTRLTLLEENLAGIRRDVANLYGLSAAHSQCQDRMDARLERIERCLELAETPPE